MTQPAAGQPRPRGNPDKRRRGEVVRAVLMATVKPDAPVPLDTLHEVTGLHRTTLLNQFARLQALGKLRGYSTRGGMVRVW